MTAKQKKKAHRGVPEGTPLMPSWYKKSREWWCTTDPCCEDALYQSAPGGYSSSPKKYSRARMVP